MTLAAIGCWIDATFLDLAPLARVLDRVHARALVGTAAIMFVLRRGAAAGVGADMVRI